MIDESYTGFLDSDIIHNKIINDTMITIYLNDIIEWLDITYYIYFNTIKILMTFKSEVII